MKEEQIFHQALELVADRRAAYLDEICGQDTALRERVGILLQAHADPGSFLASPALAAGTVATLNQPALEKPGTQIGPYKLLEQIGEGGFGVVYMAEQQQPVRRKVALKVIKPGMDSRQVIARFEAERQALALMDHPNIAKVLDAGTTETGRPYFVMELVQGVPITDYCDQCNLSTRERLDLFVSVCQAVQHAHQKGVIHRDIKPTNVLVAIQDGRAAPKIIDFGVAKAINQRLTEHTLATGYAQIIGTPLYMSPEQAELSPLGADTRSDIYSLGVLLYELLTGSTPFNKERLHSVPYDELRRIILEEEPPRPSARLSSLPLARRAGEGETAKENAIDLATIAERRHTDARRLQQTVRGELDWIVMKCLEKDRNRRYETANSLARDVERYLHDEPVQACPPSAAYRLKKFIRRNRGPVIASATVLLALIAAVIGATIGLVSQSRQRSIAERQRAEALLNLASALQSQRKYAEAEALFRQGLEIPSAATSADRQQAARTHLRLAEVVGDRSSAAEAEQLHREALTAYRDAFPPGDPNIADALTKLALLVRPQHRFDEAEPLFREAYEIHRRAIPADHRAIGESAANLANVLITLARYAEAEPLAREAIAEHQLTVPQDVWALAFARLELGRNLLALDKFPEAEAQLVEAQRILGSTDAFLAGAVALAALYTTWDKAEPGNGYDAKAQEWHRHLIGTFVQKKSTAIEAKKSD